MANASSTPTTALASSRSRNLCMPRLIDTQGQVLANPYELFARDCVLADVLSAESRHVLVNAQFWLDNREDLLGSGLRVGVWLDSDQSAGMLAQDLGKVSLIALNFPGFMDGRSYSTAVILRQQLHYAG